jgi:hypothetical protein
VIPFPGTVSYQLCGQLVEEAAERLRDSVGCEVAAPLQELVEDPVLHQVSVIAALLLVASERVAELPTDQDDPFVRMLAGLIRGHREGRPGMVWWSESEPA